MTGSSKARAFWPIALGVLLTDCATKQVAADYLAPAYTPHPVLGDWLRFVLSYNRGAATGIHLGSWARPLLTVTTIAILGLLWAWYRRTNRRDWPTAAALGLVAGGAVGNLVDRVRWDRGVVDFIDVGIGAARFWTFNVADACITCGALWLAWRLSRGGGRSYGAGEPPREAGI